MRVAAPVTSEAAADATDEAADEAPPRTLEILLPLFACEHGKDVKSTTVPASRR